MRKVIIGLTFMLLSQQFAYSQELKNVQGLMNLRDSMLFVNITEFRFVSDNEIYTPTLFALKLPNNVSDYWYNVSRMSQYIFSFKENQYLFIFDEAKNKQSLRDSLTTIVEDKSCKRITKEVAIQIIHRLATNSEERESWIERQNIPTDCTFEYHIARYKDIVFVFYNTKDIDYRKILNSFIEIQPHRFTVVTGL